MLNQIRRFLFQNNKQKEMAALFVGLLLLFSVIQYQHAEADLMCSPGCICNSTIISCCKSMKTIHTPITGYKNASQLILDYCTSLSISSRTFSDLSTLEDLTITKTNVIFIDAYAFNNLPKLQNLILTELNLNNADIHPFAFLNLKIQHLDLSKNNLVVISHSMFSGLEKLKILNLSHNKVVLIQDSAFESLSQLSFLNLDNNNLETITPFWFKQFSNYSSLQISVRGNRLSKDCRYRGASFDENHWFMMSLIPNMTSSNDEKKVPECSQPSVNDLYQAVYVPEHFSLALSCIVKGFPKPKLSWLLPSGEQVDSTMTSYIAKNGLFIIKQVQKYSAGLYACVATNSEGSAVSLYKLVVVSFSEEAPSSTTTSFTIQPKTTIAPTASTGTATLMLFWLFISILIVLFVIFLIYMLRKAYKWAKRNLSTNIEFKKFVDTPNILTVPENPQPMPHI
ncbi:leucine-rich repeat and fibronectin type III domain-containing protein 1-like protein [Rhinatrema bivittatum]|uniref:leucine-rich repeat and fibronectin type III domain-containing protein 1-like protein n=1 Tax=Rhinatrema bivittatum TaxID=194408 RepID=UPI0011290BF5|nr:leucine-rich repeat and fibronectin type III domain-containing protein 1-like protein [Rhinatrema bivittatum]